MLRFIDSRTTFLLLISFISLSCVLGSHRRRNTEGSEFDYFMLVRVFPDAVCRADDDTVPESCKIPKGTPAWTLHGLWPNFMNGSFPQFCKGTPRKYDKHAIDAIREKLLKFWPNYYPAKTADSFWKHEYEKHGTCSQSVPDFDSELKYFENSLDLNELFDVDKFLRDSGFVPRHTPYSSEQLDEAIKKHLSRGKRADFSCLRDKKTHEVLLGDIRLCLNKTSLEPIDCPMEKKSKEQIESHWAHLQRKDAQFTMKRGESPPLPTFYACPSHFIYLDEKREMCSMSTLIRRIFLLAPIRCHTYFHLQILFYVLVVVFVVGFMRWVLIRRRRQYLGQHKILQSESPPTYDNPIASD